MSIYEPHRARKRVPTFEGGGVGGWGGGVVIQAVPLSGKLFRSWQPTQPTLFHRSYLVTLSLWLWLSSSLPSTVQWYKCVISNKLKFCVRSCRQANKPYIPAYDMTSRQIGRIVANAFMIWFSTLLCFVAEDVPDAISPCKVRIRSQRWNWINRRI